jgi:hypothetical protein
MFYKADGNSENSYSRKDGTSVPLVYRGLVMILRTDVFHVAELATEDTLSSYNNNNIFNCKLAVARWQWL